MILEASPYTGLAPAAWQSHEGEGAGTMPDGRRMVARHSRKFLNSAEPRKWVYLHAWPLPKRRWCYSSRPYRPFGYLVLFLKHLALFHQTGRWLDNAVWRLECDA